jgi:hypothetical protein
VTVADDSEKRHNQSKSKTKLAARIKKAGTVLLERFRGHVPKKGISCVAHYSC